MDLRIHFEPGQAPLVRYTDPPDAETETRLTSSAVRPLADALEALWPRNLEDSPESSGDPHPADQLMAEVGRWRDDTRSMAQAKRDEAAVARDAVDEFRTTDSAPAATPPA